MLVGQAAGLSTVGNAMSKADLILVVLLLWCSAPAFLHGRDQEPLRARIQAPFDSEHFTGDVWFS